VSEQQAATRDAITRAIKAVEEQLSVDEAWPVTSLLMDALLALRAMEEMR
jgi:hypothetical protein